MFFFFFFFKQKTAYELRISDWSSDVCSSDLVHNSDSSPVLQAALCGAQDVHWHQCPVSGTASRPDAASWALIWSIRRLSPASSFASARATSTSWVFDARKSHQPSGVLTRAPSISLTCAPAARRRASTSSMTANLRRSEEHTSELQSLLRISYAVFCLK